MKMLKIIYVNFQKNYKKLQPYVVWQYVMIPLSFLWMTYDFFSKLDTDDAIIILFEHTFSLVFHIYCATCSHAFYEQSKNVPFIEMENFTFI